MSRYGEMILNMINASYEHLTAEQIYAALKQKEPKVVQATVYNNLNHLCEERKIRRIRVEGSADHYDRTARHDHLICRCCGKLSDFTFTDLTKQLTQELGNDVISYDLRVSWICPECRKKQDSDALPS